MALLALPRRFYIILAAVAMALGADFIFPGARSFLFIAAFVGAFPTIFRAFSALKKPSITIDTFNLLALVISFATGQVRSAAFIVLMLTSADFLDWRTESRTRNAVEELLRLKPEKAARAKGDGEEEIPIDAIKEGDVLIVREGSRVPADGTVTFGSALLNEAPVTGESVPVQKVPGDRILGGTLNESGVIKFRATHVGTNSTLERMAALIREAQKNKSRSERLADRFAVIFLPVVLAVGVITYLVTHNIMMVAALFLVACADDMAVAIPLAVTASLGHAARRGVVVKGGEWLHALGSINTLVLDKTGTLTYGSFVLRDADIAPGFPAERFWKLVGAAEKFSEHPVGRAIFKAAREKVGKIPDPEKTEVYKGKGIWARIGAVEVAVGDEGIFSELKRKTPPAVAHKLNEKRERYGGTTVAVMIGGTFAGTATVADVPREEAGQSIKRIKDLGVREVIMFTGDNEQTARAVAARLGITSFRASMLPEQKLRELERLASRGIVAMVGDGINDAPSLARAHVGIAMGTGGAAVAVEAADVVILTDNLARIPEMIALGRNTRSVIRSDMIIWLLSNALGFALVLTGFAGPALAAFYNFATDFLPLINSSRLFNSNRKHDYRIPVSQ